MSFLNVNNNNVSLQIENGSQLILGNPFSEDGDGDVFLESGGKMATLPPPVVLSLPPSVDVTDDNDNLESPAANGDAPEPPRESTEEEEPFEDIDDGVSVVRTRVGLFEQLSNIVFADGGKTGKVKKTAPPVIQEEIQVEEKHVLPEEEMAVETEESPKEALCDGAQCHVPGSLEDPWSSETRCTRVEGENWPQSQVVETSDSEAAIDVQRVKNFWRLVISESKEDVAGENNNNSEDDDSECELEDISSVDLAAMNSNNNNIDPESRFRNFIDGNSENMGFHAFQPSAISAIPDRGSPIARYVPPASKCRIGASGVPGAPAATEGGPANKAGIPWGAKKQRRPARQRFINQEPYQTLKPSGQWTHGTLQQQPSNKQAQVDRQDPFPHYIAKVQKCKARPEYRKKTTNQGVDSSCKRPKKRQRGPINLDAVRCNCPGLYPAHPSQGPGNYWDEEDDDEAILAEMCPGDDLEECGQGVDALFPLEEWSDEWEDGVLSGDCMNGRLAPGTLELLPHENPCLEELMKRKTRVQELRNKRWENLERARAEAKRLQAESNPEDPGAGAKAEAKGKDLEREALNSHGQKGWSLLAWFTPTNWASGSAGGDCAQENRPGKTCTTRTSTGPNKCSGGNKCSNNSNDEIAVEEVPVEPSLVKVKAIPTEEMVDYEWDQEEESNEDYARRWAKNQTQRKIEETKRRLHRMRAFELQRLRAEREAFTIAEKEKEEEEEKRPKSGGFFSSVFGIFGGQDTHNDNNNNHPRVDLGAENANNNAANRCFRPCPPCPQEDCPPPPFECPCNDIHCPKKLKANKDNVQKKGCEGVGAEIGNVNVCIDVTDDLQIEGIDISVKKPPPDLTLGCPCGDEECKKKKCDPPPPRKYTVCELRNGKMCLQEACPVQECERDICDKDDPDGEPKECPCTDDNCPKKTGGQDGFVFLYPPTDKIKLDDRGCPLQQQMHCVVTQIGDHPPHVAVKPVSNKGLHCEPVPPCPCPEFEALERGGSELSGNAWGEEIDDERSQNCNTAVAKEKSKDCGGHTAENGVTEDQFEWDFWDSPCDEAPPTPEATPDDIRVCREFMETIKGGNDNREAAIKAALEAFEFEKIRKEREKTEAATRKRRVEEMREMGMTEEEIVDQLCSDRVPGPCEIMGEFPPQEACAPNPPPPGCPCPDAACPKRAPFDYQMHDTDLAKIKSPYDRANTEKYLKSEAYKTMDCELRRPTYKDVSKSYPKRPKNNKCPCPSCVTETQKAWAEVEKMKVGPPPECPCKDPKCPKKPKKEEKNEEEPKEDLGPCAMKSYYPKQSGCLDVVRCELIRDPCGGKLECQDGPTPKPEERYKCHACSLKRPMPKQAACPDYDCKDCKLVCEPCGCKPAPCDKCKEAEELARKNAKEPEHEACPPCTVKGPLPKQSGCKIIHPCDEKHPCMCDPNTGEPIDAERCGPCDTRHHEYFPPQSGCKYAGPPPGCTPSAGNKAKNNSVEETSGNMADLQKNENHEPIESASEDAANAAEEFGLTPIDKAEASLSTDEGEDVSVSSEPGAVEPEVVSLDTVETAPVNEEIVDDQHCSTIEPEAAVEKGQPLEVTSTAVEQAWNEEQEASVHAPEAVDEANEVVAEEAPEVVVEAKSVAAESPVAEAANVESVEGESQAQEEMVDLKKGTTASVKVEFRVIGLELTDAELKRVDEAFERQEAEEAAAKKEVVEEELKKAALAVVKEKMKQSAPVEKETEVEAPHAKPEPIVKASRNSVDDALMGADDPCSNSCSFLGMEISAFVPAFMRPKAKCRTITKEPTKLICQTPLKRSTDSSMSLASMRTPASHGLNAIDGLEAGGNWKETGVVHRTSAINIGARSRPSGGMSNKWLAKRRDLVLVNNEDGAISLLNFDRISEKNQQSINQTFNTAPLITSGKQ